MVRLVWSGSLLSCNAIVRIMIAVEARTFFLQIRCHLGLLPMYVVEGITEIRSEYKKGRSKIMMSSLPTFGNLNARRWA